MSYLTCIPPVTRTVRDAYGPPPGSTQRHQILSCPVESNSHNTSSQSSLLLLCHPSPAPYRRWGGLPKERLGLAEEGELNSVDTCLYFEAQLKSRSRR
jgi:hypothetical protein